VFPIEEFGIKRRRQSSDSTIATLYRSKISKPCLIQRRIDARAANPYRHTFAQRRRNHAQRWGYSVAELEAIGWDLDRRSIEMQAMFEFGFCPNCIEVINGVVVVHFYRDMTHGLSDLTIDRLNPELPPVWPGNIQWLDLSCNIRKHDASPIADGQRIQAVHELRLSEVASDQWPDDERTGTRSLFDL
jgi:hypothetical protein